jgi:hypothetical protein
VHVEGKSEVWTCLQAGAITVPHNAGWYPSNFMGNTEYKYDWEKLRLLSCTEWK